MVKNSEIRAVFQNTKKTFVVLKVGIGTIITGSVNK
jgi:hypothetical protein